MPWLLLGSVQSQSVSCSLSAYHLVQLWVTLEAVGLQMQGGHDPQPPRAGLPGTPYLPVLSPCFSGGWWFAWRPDCCTSEAPPKSVALQGHATPVACQYVAQCCCAPHCRGASPVIGQLSRCCFMDHGMPLLCLQYALLGYQSLTDGCNFAVQTGVTL